MGGKLQHKKYRPYDGTPKSEMLSLVITGGRKPSRGELTTHLGLFRNVPMSATDLSIRMNCPPGKILEALEEYRREGWDIQHENPDEAPTIRTKWVAT